MTDMTDVIVMIQCGKNTTTRAFPFEYECPGSEMTQFIESLTHAFKECLDAEFGHIKTESRRLEMHIEFIKNYLESLANVDGMLPEQIRSAIKIELERRAL
jgi:hypothetical protein